MSKLNSETKESNFFNHFILLKCNLTVLKINLLNLADGSSKSKGSEAVTGSETGDSMEAAAPVDTSRMRFPQKLTVEQVKVVDGTGNLRVIYPSRIDLQNPAFDVIRNYE